MPLRQASSVAAFVQLSLSMRTQAYPLIGVWSCLVNVAGGHRGLMNWNALRIIVADDLRSARAIVVQHLHAAGVRDIREASDGAQAFNLFCNRSADVLLLDLEMPHSGVEALRSVRTSMMSPNRRVPVVMMTGLTTPDRIAAMRDSGATAIISKPMSAAGLISRIEGALRDPRAFIDGQTYVGPDRRRPRQQPYGGPFRRAGDAAPGEDVFEVA